MTMQLIINSNLPNFLMDIFLVLLKYKANPNIFTDARKDSFINTRGRHKKYAIIALSIFFGILYIKSITTKQKINMVII
jgi:hypothetical protein